MPVLTSDIGLSIEVPDAFAEVRDLGVGSVCLVARVEPWTRSEDFCPTVTVEVGGLAGDRATIPALSTVTINEQIALGRHVVACDVWMTGESTTPDEDSGRRIVSTYRAKSSTIVQQQYVVIRGGRAVTITVQCEPGHLRAARRAFDVAVATLRVTFEDPPVPAADRVAPRLDAFTRDVLGDPLALEDLSPIRDAEPFRAPGPDLSEDQFNALRRGKLRRSTDAGALQARRFVGEDRRLTELGRTVHDVLKRPMRRLTVEVRADGAPRSATFEAALTSETGVIVAARRRSAPVRGDR